MKKFLLLLTIAFLLLTTQAHATRYWADTAGGGASCAAASGAGDPGGGNRLTVVGAVACATVAGDEVYIKAGTYTVGADTRIVSPPSNITIRGEDSTKANWPLFQPASFDTSIGAFVKWQTVTRTGTVFQYLKFDLSGITNAPGCFGATSTSIVTNITVQDFECKGADGTGGKFSSDTASAFAPSDSSSGWIVRRGKVYNWLSADGSPGAHCFYWGADNGLIDHVECTNVNGYGLQLFGSGVSPDNNTLSNSYFHGFTLRGPVFIQTAANGNKIYNNVFADWFNRALTFSGSNTKVYNNTFYEASSVTAIFISFCGATCTIANNLISTAGTAISGSDSDITLTTNITTGVATDLMIDPANGNFNLKESSAAIDGGTVVTGFSEGRYVGSAPDVGAFEAPIRLSAVVEDATDTIYRIRFSMPIQSTRDNVGLQTCTVANIAIVVAGGGATESSCTTTALASRVDVTLGAAVTVGQSLTDAYTRSSAPTLTDNVCIGDPNTSCLNAHIRTYSAASGTNNVDGGALPAITQSRFSFFHLRGTEAAPTNICTTCTENVNMELPRGAAFSLRVKFRTDDDPPGTTYKLRVSKDGGAYGDIPDVMDTGYIAWYGLSGGSDIPAAGTPTTEVLTSDEASNTACAVVRTSSDFPVIDLNNSETECHYLLQTSLSAPLGTTWDFRVYKGDNTALDVYTVTPRLTAGVFVMGF